MDECFVSVTLDGDPLFNGETVTVVGFERRFTFEAETFPSGRAVSWGGDQGDNPQITDEPGRSRLTTRYSTPGQRTLTATCGLGTSNFEVNILVKRPPPPPPPPPPPVKGLGKPERVPEVSFVRRGTLPKDHFLKLGLEFHKSWNLEPRPFSTLHEIIKDLARAKRCSSVSASSTTRTRQSWAWRSSAVVPRASSGGA